jgi:hypothetical protein
VEKRWHELAGSLLLRVQRIHIESLCFRARAAIAAAADVPARRSELLGHARQAARKLHALDAAHAGALATLLEAGIAATEGRLDRAAAYLDLSVGKLEVAEMPMHLFAARRRLGELGRAGKIEEADVWMTAHGVKNPRAWTQMLVPGMFEQRK